MSRFSPCRVTDLHGVVKDCAGKCMNRGVRFNCPCSEPLLYGANILRDPGFESAGGGPGGDEIPVTLSGGGLQWPSIATGDATIVASDALSSGWVNEAGSGAYWKSAGAVPDSGSQHGRLIINNTPRRLRMMQFLSCEVLSVGRVAVSARVDPGDMVTIKVKTKSNVASSESIQLRLQFTTGAVGLPQTGLFDSSFTTLTTSYVEKTWSAVAPANTVYLFSAGIRILGTNGNIVDIDSCVMEIV